jgi:hypothetical protein
MVPSAPRQSRRVHALAVVVGVLILASAGGALASPGGSKGGAGGGGGGGGGVTTGGGGGKKTDTTPPAISITSPGTDATLSGAVAVSGSATDNVQLAKVEVSVDSGSFQPASGTTAWTFALASAAYADGAHTLNARATDAAGNTSVIMLSVMFRNAVSSDTTPPVVAIALPSAGAAVSGAVSVSGSASDNASVSKVEVSLDGGSYGPAQGTASWGYALDTTSLANGAHTVAARATDAAGNVAFATEAISVQNMAPIGAPVVAPQMSSGTIGGFAFEDVSRDGTYESLEQPLSDQHLFLYDGAGNYVTNAYTDSSGWYEFPGLADGSYRVEFAPASWSAIRADWVPDNTGSLLPRRAVQLAGTSRADFGWRAILRSTDASAPFSSYTGSNGLQVKSYDDVVDAREIYDRLISGSLVGAEAAFTTIRFDFASTGSTSTSAWQTAGTYTDYNATSNVSYVSWLNGDGELFHEYGHAWSLYNGYIVQQDPTLARYLAARGLLGDPRIGSSSAWSTREMIAEDYRQLFGTPSAQSLTQMNRDIPSAKDVPGLREFLAGAFTKPSTG